MTLKPATFFWLAEEIAGPPNTRRWRIVTGSTGWASTMLITAAIGLNIAGFSEVPHWLIGGGAFLFGIADHLLKQSPKHYAQAVG